MFHNNRIPIQWNLTKLIILRVEEDENIADLSPYDKYKQISSPIRW